MAQKAAGGRAGDVALKPVPSIAMSDFVPVAHTSQLPPETGMTVQVAGREVAVFNVGGRICAIDGECPHRGGPLGSGTVEGGKVFCPLHGWEYDVATGQCATRPDRPVRSHETRVIDGRIEIRLAD